MGGVLADKPKYAADYPAEQIELVRSTCLYVATILGDLMDDLVVVGGLVPTLLIDPRPSDENREPHVGTMDLDVGLALALLDAGRYRTLSERLRAAGFEPDRNPDSRPTRQRWVVAGYGTVTFLRSKLTWSASSRRCSIAYRDQRCDDSRIHVRNRRRILRKSASAECQHVRGAVRF